MKTKRSLVIAIRLKPIEYDKIKEHANKQGISACQFIRDLVLKHIYDKEILK